MPQILSAVFGSRLPKNYNHEKKTHHHLNALPTGFVGQAPSGRSAVFQRQSKRVGRTHRNGERRSGCRRRGQVDVRPFRLLESRKLRFVQCRLYAAQIGTKRWLYEAFVGHFIGSQLTYGNYLYGGSRRYYKGGMAGLGFSYGYAWLLSKRWNVTAEIGIGVFYMKDTRRDRIPPEYESIFIHHYKRWVVGPSRAEISFNYLF